MSYTSVSGCFLISETEKTILESLGMMLSITENEQCGTCQFPVWCPFPNRTLETMGFLTVSI